MKDGASAVAATSSHVTSTPRLTLRRVDRRDAAFIHALLNDPSWIRYIGNRNIRTEDEALKYIEDVLAAMYARTGFGLWAVEHVDTGKAMGLCGLIKRDALDDVDLGFAFLPSFRGNGYAYEAARATIEYARGVLGLTRVVAIVTRDNERSRRLLEKLGFRMERTIRVRPDDDELDLYALAIADASR